MQHLDPELLSLLALDESVGDEASLEHLRACGECAAEYAALRRAVYAVRTTPDTSSLEAPGPQVWAGIHRELGLSGAVAQDPLASQAITRGATPMTLHEGTRGTVPSPAAPLRPDRSAWFRRPVTWLAAAAAVVLLAGGVFWSLNTDPRPVASAELAPLAQYSATGTARVVESRDGSRSLEIRINRDEAQGYQEVWLIAPDLSKLVSLGVMNSETGTFQIPAGLDLAAYPIVDVSDEPVDGNPAHSSDSIVRGTLAA